VTTTSVVAEYDGTQMPMELAGDLAGTRDLGLITFTTCNDPTVYFHYCGSPVLIESFNGAASRKCHCGKTLDFRVSGRKFHVIERE
jgi:hypothetical protein